MRWGGWGLVGLEVGHTSGRPAFERATCRALLHVLPLVINRHPQSLSIGGDGEEKSKTRRVIDQAKTIGRIVPFEQAVPKSGELSTPALCVHRGAPVYSTEECYGRDSPVYR